MPQQLRLIRAADAVIDNFFRHGLLPEPQKGAGSRSIYLNLVHDFKPELPIAIVRGTRVKS